MEFFLSPVFTPVFGHNPMPINLTRAEWQPPIFWTLWHILPEGTRVYPWAWKQHGAGPLWLHPTCSAKKLYSLPCPREEVKHVGTFPCPPTYSFSSRGHQKETVLPSPFFKHDPHSENDAQGIIGKHWKFFKSDRISAAIYVFYPFPTNFFIFSSLFILKQIHTDSKDKFALAKFLPRS